MPKNKLQKFADLTTYRHVFQYPFSVLKEKGFDMRGCWHEKFFGNDHPIVLELGCGKGEYTVGLAQQYPDKNFIGIDIKGARIWSGATASAEQQLTNVAFLRTHIELIDNFFDTDEVSEIWITFPDPQMKKTRKRLTSTRMLALYRSFLKDNGINCEQVYWPSEDGNPQALDLIHDKFFDLVINIPKNLTSHELSNGYKIRRAAIDFNIPLITNSRLASAFIEAFCNLDIEDLPIKSWAEY